MSSASKAWGVAASIGAVEALKDQLGFCRWNHLIRSAQQYARNNGRAISRVSSSGDDDGLMSEELAERRRRRTEEYLEKVMYLSSTVGAVEALKDQGFCRWNYAIRSIQQHYKNTIRSSSRSVRKLYRGDRGNRAEESLKTIMYLSSWGPYN
ncbi:hypothetical protein LINPERPRIM_LOCUS1922 [Linum perenne]